VAGLSRAERSEFTVMLSARFLAMPTIALAVIVALAFHGRSDGAQAPTVYRAVNCAVAAADSACAFAGDNGAHVVR
jgi:hypothetical protein